MMRLRTQALAICILLLMAASNSYGQRNKRIIACKTEVFAALKPLPELTYECPDDVANEYDDSILKSPERIKVINEIMGNLQSFTSPEWWKYSVSDLNACYLRGKAGVLSAEEKEKFTGVEYQARLLGNNQIRLVLTPDSCYQTHYSGANAFLLYRKGERVYVTQVLDGYYSRLENSVSLKLFRSNAEQVIEIETANISGMRPEFSSYYFVIDKATNRAIPKKLFKRGKRLT